MFARKKNRNKQNLLKTEGPLCEKDEQANVMDRARKYQKKALELWRSLIRKKQK